MFWKRIIPVILLILLLSCCVDRPEPANERLPLYTKDTYEAGHDDVPHQSSFSGIERGNLAVIREQLSDDLQTTYNNISVTKARVSDADAMPVYDISIEINPSYDSAPLLDYLYAGKYDITDESNYSRIRVGDPISKDYPAYTEPTYDESAGGYLHVNAFPVDIDTFSPAADDPTLVTAVYSCGEIVGTQTGEGIGENAQKWKDYKYGKIIKRFDLYYESPKFDEAYMMTDGQEWNAADAIAFVEDFWNTYVAESEPEKYTYSVKTLWVVSIGDDGFAYLFAIQKQDANGNYYDCDLSQYYFQENDIIEANEPFLYTNELMTICAEKETINRFTKNFSFKPDTATDDGNNLLTLGKATEILSNSLARNLSLNLSAELNYVVFCKGYPYFQQWENPYFFDFLCLAECEFEIRPVWCFRQDNQCFILNPTGTNRFFVDAVTGEVSTIVNNDYRKFEG